MIYLASPYSHKNKELEKLRHEQVKYFVQEYRKKTGKILFSPIVYGVALHNANTSSNFIAWKNFDLDMLKVAKELFVLMLSGYENSEGVQEEIKYAKLNNIKITYIDFKP